MSLKIKPVVVFLKLLNTQPGEKLKEKVIPLQ